MITNDPRTHGLGDTNRLESRILSSLLFSEARPSTPLPGTQSFSVSTGGARLEICLDIDCFPILFSEANNSESVSLFVFHLGTFLSYSSGPAYFLDVHIFMAFNQNYVLLI